MLAGKDFLFIFKEILYKINGRPSKMEKYGPLLSITDATKIAKVPVALIKRAIKNKIVIPIKKNQSYYFSSEEVQKWSHFDQIGSLIQNRLYRDTQNEYRGCYIEAGNYSPRNDPSRYLFNRAAVNAQLTY
ncbi:MAG: hypothetical protein KAV87_06710 [Desulfobacteraceae bacterium]|nr:hypothetical protein [Desulfobacteraceae bacterium]